MITESFLLSQVPSGVAKCARNKTYPSITYWIAIQSPNGAPVDALVVHRALVKCEVEVNSTRASAKKGGCDILNKLCQLVKDHKNDFMCDLIMHSYKRCLKELYEDISGEALTNELYDWERVVRMVIVRQDVIPSLNNSVARLKEVGLEFDLINVQDGRENDNNTADPPKQLGEPMTVLLNDIERAMKKLNYAYREGDVYKLQAQSRMTFTRLCSIESFLNSLLGNPYFKDSLLTHMSKLQAILKHPDCQAIPQIEIDKDLVEVYYDAILNIVSLIDGWIERKID